LIASFGDVTKSHEFTRRISGLALPASPTRERRILSLTGVGEPTTIKSCMADQPKQINFTIIPDDVTGEGTGGRPSATRTYSNFCSIAHTPFDFTLTFCEVMPLSDKEIREAESEHVVRAPVRAKIVVPVQFVPNLIGALQEHWRVFSESYGNVGWNKGTEPVH
jgi:hypothetical protein